ncbi:Alcohol dehydrogenase-like 7, partial [Linum perenne]
LFLIDPTNSTISVHSRKPLSNYRVVESVGEDVDDLNPGDRVIPIFLPDCGDQCPDCRSKKSNLCSRMPRDGTSRFKDLDGNSIHHFLSVSSFSEYTVVDGIGATWRAAEVDEGSTVAIFGLGTIGMAVAEGARLRGAARIIGIDTNPERFEIRKKFGITEFVNPGSYGDKPVSQVIREMTDGGGGADYCFECAGSPFLMEQAYASARKGWGKTVVLGVGGEGSEMKIKCMEVLQSGKMLTGALFGGLKPKSDIPVLLKRYMDKELDLDKFVMKEMELKDINKAFDLLLQGNCLRCVIWLNKGE